MNTCAGAQQEAGASLVDASTTVRPATALQVSTEQDHLQEDPWSLLFGVGLGTLVI